MVVLAVNFSVRAETKVQADLSHVGDTTHLELRGQKTWVYSLRRIETNNGPAIRLEAPDMEPDSFRKLKLATSPLVAKVEWVEQESSIDKMVILFHLARPDVRTFDYQVADPSQLIVDFYIDNPAAQTANSEKKTETQKIARVLPEKRQLVTSTQKIKTKSVSRKPASDVPPQASEQEGLNPDKAVDATSATKVTKPGVLDGSDPEYLRFAIKSYQIRPESIQQSKQNVYLPIPMLQMPYTEIDDIVSSKPVYQILPGEGEENEQARFLLTLFEKRRYAAFLKAYKVFKHKFVNSKYSELLEYIYADIHLQEYETSKLDSDFERAINTYSELMVRYPQSPMYDRTAILVANAYFQKGELVRALRNFQKYVNDRPESPHRDVIRLAMAHAFAGVNQYETATNVLADLSKNAVKSKYAIEAKFRLGDAAFIQRKYEQAGQIYEETLKGHIREASLFPNILFNLAESQFWLGKYPESLENFRAQLKAHPSHPYSAYALTRLGELLEILGLEESKSHAALMESYFRFYPHPGAKIARVRLLAHKLKGMKLKEFTGAVKEIMAIGEKNEIPGMNEFVTLALTDGLFLRGDFKDAIDRLIKYHQHHPTSLNLGVFRSRIARILVDDIKKTIDTGDFIGGLDLYEKHSTVWLKGINRRDLRYYLARAFENGGVFAEAQKQYEELLKETLEDDKTPPNLDVFDEAPHRSQLHLRLARVLFEQEQYAKSVDHLKQISSENYLKDEEKIERVEIAAQVFQKTGLNQDAVQMLTRLVDTWRGRPELTASPILQKAKVLASMDKISEAVSTLETVLKVNKDSGKVADGEMVSALRLLGEWNVRQKKTPEAINYFQEALNTYEARVPMPDIRYHLGQAYLETGNLREAEKAWQKLDPNESRVWYQMAQEQMKQDRFRADYKKYIDRIPAMNQMGSNMTGGKQ